MIPPDIQRLLKETYSDIIQGFSRVKYQGKILFIKHSTIFDSFSGDECYDDYFNKAIKNKIPASEDRLKFLKETGLWSDKKENDIKDKRFFVENLKITKSKLAVLKSQQDQIIRELDRTNTEIRTLEIEKAEALGLTAESFANRKTNEFNILNSFYTSIESKTRYFDSESLDDLDDNQFSQIIEVFNKNNEKFTTLNIKRVALAPYFLNFFFLCDNDPVKFYGKPIVSFTFYQAELFSQGAYFKNILSEMKDKLPPDILDNPDELISTYESNKNSQEKFQNSKEMSARGIMGATKEDYIRMGMGDQLGPDLREVAAKKGGALNIHDIIKAHGE